MIRFGTILLTLAVASHAQAGYDAVADFSNTSNPNGAWQYLASNGTTSSLLTQHFNATANIRGWINNNNNGIPDRAYIAKNFGTATDSYATIVLPTNLLVLDGEGLNAIVRWTAPTAGIWSISGLFQGVDVDEAAHNVEILENSTTALLAPTAINSYGARATFNDTVTLNAGDTIDFIELTGNGGYFLSTGLSASITDLTSVPEPSSVVMLGLGLGAVAVYRRRRRVRSGG